MNTTHIIKELYEEENEEENNDEDEEEREYMKSIYMATLNANTFDFKQTIKQSKVEKSKPKVVKSKVTLSLNEFTSKIEQELMENQPKKFVSKRADDKRKILGIDDNIIKRTFNPRKPPYNFINRKVNNITEVDLDNKLDFPSL